MQKPASPLLLQFVFAGIWFLGIPVVLQLFSSIYFLNLATTGLNPTAGFMAVFLLPWLSPWMSRTTLPIPFAAALFAISACSALLLQAHPLARVLICIAALTFLILLILSIEKPPEWVPGIIGGWGLYGLYLAAGDTYRPEPIVDRLVTLSFIVAWLAAAAKTGSRHSSAAQPGEVRPAFLASAVSGFWIFAQLQFFQFPGTILAWTSLGLPIVAILFLLTALLSLQGSWVGKVPRYALFVASCMAAFDLSHGQRFSSASLFVLLLSLFESLKSLAALLKNRSRMIHGLPSTLIMVLSFAWIFTFAYDQARLLGSELFRDQAPGMLLIVSIVAVSPILFRKPNENRAGSYMALVLLIAGTVGVAFTLRNSPQPSAEPGNRIRVGTYNIYQGFTPAGLDSRRGLLNFLSSENPQLLGLQESDTSRFSSQSGNIVEWLARKHGMHMFFGPNPGRGGVGVSTLSRLPLLESSVTELSSIGRKVHVIRTRHRLAGREFHFLVTHFGLTDEDRIRQTEETIRLLQSIRGPKILAGDFNLNPRKEPHRKLLLKLGSETGLIDVQSLDGPPTHLNGWRIDTIFASPEFEILQTKVMSHVTASDHFPVLAELQWRITEPAK